jgi:hypothetical protein
LLKAAATLTLGLGTWAVLTTVLDLYPGTGVVYARSEEKPAVVHTIGCVRQGPIGLTGLGYWWSCDVTVDVSDGRVVNTRVGRSILTPKDIGKAVDFREACFGDNNTDCSYGRPVNRLWGLGAKLWRILRSLITIGFAAIGLTYLLGALLGEERTNRLIRHKKTA